MKVIKTPSFEKISLDLNRNPTSVPETGIQPLIFEKERHDVDGVLARWRKNKKVPTSRVYQLGVDVPDIQKDESNTL